MYRVGNSDSVDTGKLTELGFGGEGTVYQLDSNRALKIFSTDTLTAQLDKWDRIDAIRSRFASDSWSGLDDFIVQPLDDVFLEAKDDRVGYTMKLVSNGSQLGKFIYDIESSKWPSAKLSDDRIKMLCIQLFDILKALHENRIIVGDLNAGNVLIDEDSLSPFFIDIDSAQLPNHHLVMANPDEWHDPRMFKSMDTQGQARYMCSKHTDIFALAVATATLVLGENPFNFGNYCLATDNPLDMDELKIRGISVFRFELSKKLEFDGVEFDDDDLLLKRVGTLKSSWPELFKFFCDVFNENKRYYFNPKPKDKKAAPAKANSLKAQLTKPYKSRQVRDDRSDPPELKAFMNLYQIRVS